MRSAPALLLALVGCSADSVLPVRPAAPARSDEGMWTFDNFPADRVRASFGSAPDAAWLERVRLHSVRLGNGCSGSLVSKHGLVLTNHHCVAGCVEQLSTPEQDLLAGGFSPKSREEERRCPAFEVNVLDRITDVTAEVKGKTDGKTGQAFQDAKKAVIGSLEKDCAGGDDARRCDVVDLYRGGRYHLYAYRRYQDVRLAFAPEMQVAFFGGDPDNFNFPRYNLDFAFLRVYQDGAPLPVDNPLKWRDDGPDDGELVYVSGHPGSTRRLMTVAQLTYERDFALPETLMMLGELRGRLSRMSEESEESARIAKGLRFGIENAYKAYRGRREALVDPSFFAAKVEAEDALRWRIEKDPALAADAKSAYGEIEAAVASLRDSRFEIRHVEAERGYSSSLFRHARTLARWAAERKKPSAERLPEFSDARLPQLKAQLGSTAPIYPELEIEVLAFGLETAQRELGPGHPFVKQALGDESPRAVAKALVSGTALVDPMVRLGLFEGEASAIDGDPDPMLAFARRIDPLARAARDKRENEIEAAISGAGQRIAQARFALYGTEVYPDATFSLRLSFGRVKGFPHLGEDVPPFTDFGGMFRRATGAPPFRLPESVLAAKDRLDPKQRLNFVTTNDIIGGNSGSPALDAEARVVGLVFDGNIHSLGGDYGYDGRANRAVSVHAGAITAALDAVWGQAALLAELDREP